MKIHLLGDADKTLCGLSGEFTKLADWSRPVDCERCIASRKILIAVAAAAAVSTSTESEGHDR